MDWGLVARILLAIVGIFTAAKVLYDIGIGKKSNLREEYKFAKEFLDDTDKTKLHPFTLGKGYQAIAGTDAVNAKEIEYILSLENPIQCLKDFILSKQLFERLETEGDFNLVFKKKYQSSFSRWWRKKLYFSLYFALAFTAISPVILPKALGLEFVDIFLPLFFTVPCFGFYAWMALEVFGKLNRAEHLASSQKQYYQRIVFDTSRFEQGNAT